MPNDLPADQFEQIPWADWLTYYWIGTLSQYLPRVFVKANQHHREAQTPSDDDQGSADLRTQYFDGADGFTYERRRAPETGEDQVTAIYKTKKDL